MKHAAAWLLAAAAAGVQAQQQTVTVHAAGSLRAALTELARDYEAAQPGQQVQLVFGASGLLKDRLAGGEASDVFASANMAHPQALAEAGKADPVQRFARNALCALVHPSLPLTPGQLVTTLLDANVKVGTSTPRADPSGDYAFEMFERIERLGAAPEGAAARLKAKALQLTGGPNSPPPPAGRSVYAALVAGRQADVFITYCTNAVVAQREEPALRIVTVPEALNVAADYGIAVLRPGGRAFVAHVLSPAGQAVLARHGFAAPQ